MSKQSKSSHTDASRRDFMKQSSLIVAGSAAVVGGSLNIARAAHSYGSDLIKIGLIGCGGRGTQAAMQALNTKGGDTKVIALGDVFPDRVQAAYRGLKGRFAEQTDVPDDRQFSGFDAYKKVLQTDCDLVILATPPGFRPLHFAAAVAAGKHVFAEKPVAVDAQGIRHFLEANEQAKSKNLAVAIGLQRRHERKYMETVKAIQDGAIGDIILARAYWNGDKPWFKPRQKDWTELEYQMRNWYQFNWLCGDHIVEQHIHNLDVINWIMNDYPVTAQGQGGSQFYNGPDYGEIFDHHFVEFTYKNGCTMLSQCRHIPNTWNSVSEHVHGTKGSCDVSGSKIYQHGKREPIHNFGNLGADGHQQEHHDLFADLRAGRIPAEGEWGAKSTFTAIFGRLATYSGQVLNWDKCLKESVDVAPVSMLANMTSFQNDAPVKPLESGLYEHPMPGRYKVFA
jgi:predicted dehydrogenase